MLSTGKTILALLAVFILFSGCIQQPSQSNNTGSTNSTATVDDYTAQQVSDIEASDLDDLGTELDDVSTSLDEIEQADVGEIDTTQ